MLFSTDQKACIALSVNNCQALKTAMCLKAVECLIKYMNWLTYLTKTVKVKNIQIFLKLKALVDFQTNG